MLLRVRSSVRSRSQPSTVVCSVTRNDRANSLSGDDRLMVTIGVLGVWLTVTAVAIQACRRAASGGDQARVPFAGENPVHQRRVARQPDGDFARIDAFDIQAERRHRDRFERSAGQRGEAGQRPEAA